MRAAMRTKGITSTQKLVLVCLADHADDDGLAYPSVSTISSYTGLKDRAIRAALDALLEGQIIQRASTPIKGSTQRWTVSNKPLTSASNAALLKEEPRHFVPVTSASNAGGGRHLMPQTSASNADKATKKQPVEATKKALGVAADAAPTVAEKKPKPVKPEKTDKQKDINSTIRRLRSLFWEHFAPMSGMDAEWMGKNLSKVLGSYTEDDIAGTLRAIAAKHPDAKAKGRTLSFINLGLWVDEWQDAGRPEVFPGVVMLHLPGVTNGNATSGTLAASKTLADSGRFEPWKDKYGPRGTSHLSLTAHRDAG